MDTSLQNEMFGAIEEELQRQVQRLNNSQYQQYFEMLSYHMGWSGDGTNAFKSGKRTRPLLLLLCAACGKQGYDWHRALPAAAAFELIHNFSLIHDDIQDGSETRRNRLTVWKKWGMPMGINAGDGLFAIANLSLMDLERDHDQAIVLKACHLLHETCLNLTCGQFLDMSFETRENIPLDSYWSMISLKTANLISAGTEIGALISNEPDEKAVHYKQFGHYLGLAFQIKDDILAIWGSESVTGKSVSSDLVSGKKSLPILFGLHKGGPFSVRWQQGPINPDEVAQLADQLTREGAKLLSFEALDKMNEMTREQLRLMVPEGPAGEALHDLVSKLEERIA